MSEQKGTEAPPMTQARFSELLTQIASNAARWAGDYLSLPDEHHAPMPREAALRFTADIRRRLERIEEQARG